MTPPTDSAIERAIGKLKAVSKDYIDIRDRPAWSRGFDAGAQAARMVLSAAYPQGEPHGQHRDLLDEIYGRVEAENDLSYGERR